MASVDDHLKCPICLELLDTPTILPCGHALCRKHLQQLLSLGKVRCPECRKKHNIPPGGVTQFPTDYSLMGVINADRGTQQGCRQCRKDKPLSNCLHCQNHLCKDCLGEHKLMLTNSFRSCLRGFSRDHVSSETLESIHQQQKENDQKRQMNEQERINIDIRTDEIIDAVKKRKGILLQPFVREKKLLDIQHKRLTEMSESKKLYGEIITKFGQANCSMRDILESKTKLDVLINRLDGNRISRSPVIEDIESPGFIDFTHHRHDLIRLIKQYGQNVEQYGQNVEHSVQNVCDFVHNITIGDAVQTVRHSVQNVRDPVQNVQGSVQNVQGSVENNLNHRNVKLMQTLTGEEDGSLRFEYPRVLTVCPHTGNVYITNTSGLSIREYEPSGQLVRSFKTDYRTRGVAIDSKRRIIFISFENNDLSIYDHNSTPISSAGSLGSGDGKLNGPIGVVCDSDDNIYVAELHNHRISVFTSKGSFLRHIGRNRLSYPRFIQITGNRKLLVSNNNGLSVFSLDGTHEGNMAVSDPRGICLDKNGYILVADGESCSICVFTQDFLPHTIINNQQHIFHNMWDIALTEQYLFVSNRDDKQIHILQ